MRQFAVTLLLLFMLVLTGCGMEQSADSSDTAVSEKLDYSSDTSPEDCYLCGGGIESLIPSYWGQNNIALISINTFEIKPIEINRYDRDGRLIEECSGVASLSMGGSKDGGFHVSLMTDYDRGYALGSLDFGNDEVLDIEKVSSFLCTECLNEILPQHIERCYGVGVLDLSTRELRLLEENTFGFGVGDFYTHWHHLDNISDTSRIDLLFFYSPLRYKPD